MPLSSFPFFLIFYNISIVFLSFSNYVFSGLVHKSQMSSVRIDEPSEMLAKGEKVYCKVIAMEVRPVMSMVS